MPEGQASPGGVTPPEGFTPPEGLTPPDGTGSGTGQIPAAVALNGRRPLMCFKAVELDDQPLLAPQRVDHETSDLRVHLWERNARAFT